MTKRLPPGALVFGHLHLELTPAPLSHQFRASETAALPKELCRLRSTLYRAGRRPLFNGLGGNEPFPGKTKHSEIARNEADRSGVPYGPGPPITLIVGAKDGVDTSSLQATLGHRDIKDTTRYTALAPDWCKGSNEIKVGSTVPTRARRTLNRRVFSSRASL